MAESTATSAPSEGLKRDAIGLTEVLFQSITHMAPAVATALSIGLATLFAGGITPLAVVFALVACLFTAYSMSQLARHLSSAGGMYTYVTRGLGTFFGWLMAWAFTPGRTSTRRSTTSRERPQPNASLWTRGWGRRGSSMRRR